LEYIEKVAGKFPQLSADILLVDNSLLYEQITKEDTLLDTFFQFLQFNNLPYVFEQNWIKIYTRLLTSKTTNVITYMLNNDGIVQGLIDHIGIQEMQDLILKLMGCENLPEEDEFLNYSPFDFNINFSSLKISKPKPLLQKKEIQTLTKWFLKNDIVKKMIEKMDPSFSEEIHSSVTYVLAEIIARSVKKKIMIMMRQH